MLGQKDFFKKYNISGTAFRETGLAWKQLREIYYDYESSQSELEPDLTYIAGMLQRAQKVHSIKVRLKEPEHLIEKIIRKKQEDKMLKVDVDNYRSVITDLVGARALHLFKEDWLSIHKHILGIWKVKGEIIANIREGDSKGLIKLYKKNKCKVKEHQFGYRSVHYIIALQLSKNEILAEIQVRTIFEEGWSEIDHLIRYPYIRDDLLLEQSLVMFNRLAGGTDEMASYIRLLHGTIQELERKTQQSNNTMASLKQKVDSLNIKQQERRLLKSELDRLSDFSISGKILKTSEGEPIGPLDITAGVTEHYEALLGKQSSRKSG